MLSFLVHLFIITYSIVSSSEQSCSTSSTGSDIAGPFYISGAPNRAIIYDSTVDDGVRLKITGTVTNLNCEPLSNVYIDFWQADPNGVYDANGYNFRGGLYTDTNGKYELYTLYPGNYSGRPEHIHVKIFINGLNKLTSQIYFDGFIGYDPWYDIKRAITIYPETIDNTSFTATFNFIGDWQQPSNIDTTSAYTTTSTQAGNTESTSSVSSIITSTDAATTEVTQISTSVSTDMITEASTTTSTTQTKYDTSTTIKSITSTTSTSSSTSISSASTKGDADITSTISTTSTTSKQQSTKLTYKGNEDGNGHDNSSKGYILKQTYLFGFILCIMVWNWY